MRGFLILLVVTSLQCRKSVPPPNILPPMTQEGKNTFGCVVNGEVWTPYYQCGLINFLTQCEELHTVVTPFDTASKLRYEFNLFTSRKIGQGSFSSFIITTGILKTGNMDSSFVVTFNKDSIVYYPRYPLNRTFNALTVTKLDTINQIISGTFYFTMYSNYNPTGDSVVITDGRFDVTYNACLCH